MRWVWGQEGKVAAEERLQRRSHVTLPPRARSAPEGQGLLRPAACNTKASQCGGSEGYRGCLVVPPLSGQTVPALAAPFPPSTAPAHSQPHLCAAEHLIDGGEGVAAWRQCPQDLAATCIVGRQAALGEGWECTRGQGGGVRQIEMCTRATCRSPASELQAMPTTPCQAMLSGGQSGCRPEHIVLLVTTCLFFLQPHHIWLAV
jgi:hypothetical protein